MAESDKRMASIFLRYASPLTGLRKVPVIGDVLSWTGRRLVPMDTRVWAQIEDGPAKDLWIRVNPRTGHSVLSGKGELPVQTALVENLLPGMVFYDLGANIGFFSLLGARLVGLTGYVHSFEADPEIATRLKENLAFNHFVHATIEQKAVWSESKEVIFERVDAKMSPDRGLGHVSSEAVPTSKTIQVEAVALDEYTTTHPAPDFVKCDVEGAEVRVFQGANKLMQEKRPIALVETHSEENHRAIKEMFERSRYSCQELDGNHILARPR